MDFIHANSPQAKGRVERLFRTLQDRLIKEMRLAHVKSLDEANRLLARYLSCFNRRFRVQAVENANLHRPIPAGIDLDNILCIKTERPLRNDYTVMHEKKVYQVLKRTKALRVTVEERVNGNLYLRYKGERLPYKEIPRALFSAPRRYKQKVIKQYQKRWKESKPPKNHPWRHFVINPHKKTPPCENRALV